MAGSVRSEAGGIAGLVRLLSEHGEAVEFDLIRLGLRLDWLGSEALSWRDLLVIVRQSGPESALWRVENGHSPLFDAELARSMEYSLRWLVWAKSKDAQRNANRPEPWQFAWEKKPNEYLGDVMTREEFDRVMGWTTTTKGG